MGIGFLRALGYVAELGDRLGVVANALGIGLAPHVSTLSGSVWFFGLRPLKTA